MSLIFNPSHDRERKRTQSRKTFRLGKRAKAKHEYPNSMARFFHGCDLVTIADFYYLEEKHGEDTIPCVDREKLRPRDAEDCNDSRQFIPGRPRVTAREANYYGICTEQRTVKRGFYLFNFLHVISLFDLQPSILQRS